MAAVLCQTRNFFIGGKNNDEFLSDYINKWDVILVVKSIEEWLSNEL